MEVGEVVTLDPQIAPIEPHDSSTTMEIMFWSEDGDIATVRLPVSGLKWSDVGTAKPKNGTSVQNKKLAQALKKKTEFTEEEWEDFDIAGLHLDHFIKSDNSYYMPFELPEGFLPKKDVPKKDVTVVARRGLRATVSPS